MGTTSLKNESPEVGSKVWDWRVRSIEVARYARIHPRAKRAFVASLGKKSSWEVVLGPFSKSQIDILTEINILIEIKSNER